MFFRFVIQPESGFLQYCCVHNHPSGISDFQIQPHFLWDVRKDLPIPKRRAQDLFHMPQIMHMTKTLHTTDRELHYFYGARALNEVFYLQDFQQLEKDFPNFHFHLALDRPDPAADAAGVKYTAGFVHNVMYETYLKDHEAPEDIEYYMCGPGPMSNAVVKMLDSLGVEPSSIMYDNFGG